MIRRTFKEPGHGTCDVHIICGDVASRDQVRSIELSALSMDATEAHALVAKTLNAATRVAAEVHNGYRVTVSISKDAPL